MQLSKTHRFILFTLGVWYEQANRKLEDKQLQISISKALFIEMVKKAGIVEKEERALYKNLEVLEKKKIIKYENKSLALTKKGRKYFLHIYNEMLPYLSVVKLLEEKSPLSYSKRLQTRFSL